MYTPIVVHRGRTTIVQVALGIDVSESVLTSEIRIDKDSASDLIATWAVSFLTDGSDGEVILTLDNSITNPIQHTNGFMDIKRIANGEPINVFDDPLPVVFKGVVTA